MSKAKWNRQRVIDAIRQRQQRGLKMTSMCRQDKPLDRAARRLFGSWPAAMRAAGLSPYTHETWSKERIIAALHAWYQTHSSTRRVRYEYPSLYSAARHHFGNLSQALRAAGLPPNRQQWTRQRVLDALRLHCGGEAPLATFWNHRPLAGAAIAYFGSRHAAFLAAGLKSRAPRQWTKAEVLAGIRQRHQQGLTLLNVGEHDRQLHAAALRLFGNWHQALAAAGLTVPQRIWSKERIIGELRALEWRPPAKRKAPSPALESAAVRHFGSVRKARLAAGIDPNGWKWSLERVVEALQDRYVRGLPLQETRCHRSLRSAARRCCGNWRKALAAAGIVSARKQP